MDLRVDRSLQIVARLRQTAADFSKKEELLAKELRDRGFALKRKLEQAKEASESESAGQLAETEARLQEAQERIRNIHASRSSRIHRVYSSGVRDMLHESKRTREKWLADLQMRHLQAERALPIDLKASETEYTKFSGALAEQRAALQSLDGQARRALTGYGGLANLLRREPVNEGAPTDGRTRDELFDALQEKLNVLSGHLVAFRRLPLPRIFSYVPLPLAAVIIVVLAGAIWWLMGAGTTATQAAGGFAIVAALVAFVLHRIGLGQAKRPVLQIASVLKEAAQLHDTCGATAVTEYQAKYQAIKDEYQRTCTELQEQWDQADEVEMDVARDARQKVEKQVPRALARNEKLLRKKMAVLEASQAGELEACRSAIADREKRLAAAQQAELEAHNAEEKRRWQSLGEDWKQQLAGIRQEVDELNTAARIPFADWTPEVAESWNPPKEFVSAAKFGQLEVDLTKYSLPKRLPPPETLRLSLPLALSFPDNGSLLFETNDSGEAAVIGTLNHVVLRLLATMPPGKISCTIIDPVGLGQNFAGLMHLSDYEESLINRRIWTQRDQIEERLEELNEHIEKVIQMYLRNEFATITEYNAQAGSVAEKYHFLVIADFPANFSETAAKRLQSIAISGPRCGVFTLAHWDRRQPQPDGFVSEELRKNAICIHREQEGLVLTAESNRTGTKLLLDAPPSAELAAELVHKIGKGSVDSNRVEVPFERVAPAPEEMWTNETTNELKIAIGRTGATKLQYLAIGKGTRQHALFAGKTGSGKSTLFHVIITNLALACSPDQVEFYLIDFKKGVEFKCYAANHLPHARVVAIESDREFGLSVLQRVDEELKRRGDMFRKLGVQDIAGYRKAGGTEPVPRSLLIIDEFQEFFVEDDEIAQNASVLFDRIVRQGRAFGIHVLLGSQTLGGAYSLARATLGQMVIRVALQCNEADAYLIMDDNNSAPRLLSRPGEGIYNDAAGAIEGNSPFQVVWLGDDERDQWLDRVHTLARERGDTHPGPIVFEGNAPADLHENYLLKTALASRAAGAPSGARCWLGAPNSIKGPTEAVFHRQSGNHLLVVGQREEAALAILGVSMLSLAAQYPVDGAKFYLFHNAAPGTADAQFLDRVVAAIPHKVIVAQGNDVGDRMNEISEELKTRSSDQPADAPAVFVFVHGLQKFKKLRHEDDFDFSMSSDSGANPGAQLTTVICEGSSLGLHLIASVDTFNNVNRFLSRKALSEIEMRVVFQMSANDSSSLIDSPKASGLGLHRALLYNEQQGTLETFRPYAMPDAEWIKEAGEKLRS